MCIPCLVDVMLTSLKSYRSPCTWHCYHAAERDAKSLSFRRCGHPVRQNWTRWTTASVMGYPSTEGLSFADPWCEGVERTSAEGVETAGPPIISAAIAQWRNSLESSWKPVSMKQTKHSRKSEAQNLCSKCLPFMRTYAYMFAWMVDIFNINFEHKFWAPDFLLCFVCFFDTGFRKCDRYKHVQSANIVWNVLLLCLTLSRGMVAT